MSERFKTYSAVMLILERETLGKREFLLQKRQNTGYMDGMWDCAASGHVESGESMKMAVIREAREELGIEISLKNIRFATMTHKFNATNDATYTYFNGFFAVSNFIGEPRINEPNKCSDIKWFDINNLPDNLIPDRIHAIKNYINHISYDEYGWSSSF